MKSALRKTVNEQLRRLGHQEISEASDEERAASASAAVADLDARRPATSNPADPMAVMRAELRRRFPTPPDDAA